MVQPETSELQEQVNSFRQLITTLLILMIVGSGTFTIFMYRQFQYSRIDATALRQIVYEYNNTNVPAIQDLRTRLQDYARTHPDFGPLANKYGLLPPSTPAAPNSAAVAPTSSPAKK